MYKMVQNNVPENVSQKFFRNADIHSYNTRTKDNFHVISTSKQLKLMSTNQKGIRLWNELPQNIKDSASLCCFKKTLKKWFIENY